jgi:CheY-specific phosphatase CheX
MKKTQEVLMNSIFEVFEKMFFVFLEPLDEDVRYDMITSIHFSGPMQGEIKAYLSGGIAGIMVQNMLGLEPGEVTEKTMEDCAKEALNMIAGSFLNKLEPKKVFDLSIPAYNKTAGNFSKNPDLTLSLVFDSDDYRMGITLNVEQNK